MYFIFILGAYNNAGLVPLANIITPGVPPPPPYTPNPVAAGKIRLFGVFAIEMHEVLEYILAPYWIYDLQIFSPI